MRKPDRIPTVDRMLAELDAVMEDEAIKRVRIEFGDGVFAESPSYPQDRRGAWTVWDSRPVRQGARSVGSGLSFEDARSLALETL